MAQAITHLEELNLLNDPVMANRQAQLDKHKGNRFIRHNFQQKGFDEELINSTIDSLPSEYNRAFPEARKRLRTMHTLDSISKENTLLTFLSNNGFNSDTCYQVVAELKKDSII